MELKVIVQILNIDSVREKKIENWLVFKILQKILFSGKEMIIFTA